MNYIDLERIVSMKITIVIIPCSQSHSYIHSRRNTSDIRFDKYYCVVYRNIAITWCERNIKTLTYIMKCITLNMSLVNNAPFESCVAIIQIQSDSIMKNSIIIIFLLNPCRDSIWICPVRECVYTTLILVTVISSK